MFIEGLDIMFCWGFIWLTEFSPITAIEEMGSKLAERCDCET
jgi:hypothetical protein